MLVRSFNENDGVFDLSGFPKVFLTNLWRVTKFHSLLNLKSIPGIHDNNLVSDLLFSPFLGQDENLVFTAM